MSIRALKKKEIQQLQQQQHQQQQNPYKKCIYNKSKQQHSTNDYNINKRSMSYPNLSSLSSLTSYQNSQSQLQKIHNKNHNYSEPDFSNIQMHDPVMNDNQNNTRMDDNREQLLTNLSNAKSEICLKTISVHNTISIDTSPEQNNNNNNIESKFTNNQNTSDSIIISDCSTESIDNHHSESSTTSTIPTNNNNNNNSNHPHNAILHEFANFHNVRIPIIGYEVMEERARFTVYKLRVENLFSNHFWLVLRRYTDFVRLNQKLKSTFPEMPNLTLPGKKLFGNNFSSMFLDNRAHGLQLYINAIMANVVLSRSRIVREFFCIDEPPAYSESMEECRAIFEAQEETITHLKLQLNNQDDVIKKLQNKLVRQINEMDMLKSKLRNNRLNCDNCNEAIQTILDDVNNFNKLNKNKF